MASGSNSRGLVLLLITSGFFITGLLFDYMPLIIDDHIKRTIELATNEEIVSYWSRPPVDVHTYYWLYDVVNPDSRLEKRIVELSANKYRIIYNSTRYSRLNDSFATSGELLDERLTLVNPIYGSIIEGSRVQAAEAEPQQRALLLTTINRLIERYNESLLVRNTSAREALLGRRMPVLEKLHKLAQTFGIDSSQLPELPADGRVGYVSVQNGTWSGPYEIYTGYQETAKSMGDLISYKGKRRLSYFEGKCNRLQASVGELRPMPIDARQTLELFSAQFCRIAHLRPTGQHKMREGQAISYVVAQEEFLGAHANPDNRCYCTNSTADNNHCSLNGVIDLAPCSYDSPLLLTMSHIELDARITSTLADFYPDLFRGDIEQVAPSDDQIQLLILKRVGIPVHADLTFTLLMKVVRDPLFRHTANVPPVSYVPLATIRETVTIPQRLAQVIVNLESFIALTYHIKVIMYLSAVVLLCWLTGHYYCRTSQQGERVAPSSCSAASSFKGDPSGGGGGSSGTNGAPGSSRTVQGGGCGDESGSGPNAGIPTAIGQSLDQGEPGDSRRQMNVASTSSSSAAAGTIGRAEKLEQQQQRQTQSGPFATSNTAVASKQRGQKGARRSSSQVAAAVAAATAETASSERANSADSNCSLPPSRQASRLSSLEAATNLGSQARQNEDSSPSRPPTEPGEPERNSAPPKPREVGPEKDPDNAASTASLQRQFRSFGARMFSKVDELGRGESSGEQQQQRQSHLEVVDLGLIAQHEGGDTSGGHETKLARRGRKNWFMNACSSFVRMLNGLRTSINEAGKLDLSENSYQDKQLEMLAGKIDNWYTEAAQLNSAASSSAPASAAGAQPAAANVDDLGEFNIKNKAPPSLLSPHKNSSNNSNNNFALQDSGAPSSIAERACQTEVSADAPDKQRQKHKQQPKTNAQTELKPSPSSCDQAASNKQETRENKFSDQSQVAVAAAAAASSPEADRSPKAATGEAQRTQTTGQAVDGQNSAGEIGELADGLAASLQRLPKQMAVREAEQVGPAKTDSSLTGGGGRLATDSEEEEEEEEEEDDKALADSVAEAANKASTLERIEKALEEEPPSTGRETAAADSSKQQPPDAAEDRRRETNRPTMINSSTSFDSVINLNELSAGLNQSANNEGQLKVDSGDDEQSADPNGTRIDESSTAAVARSGRLEDLAQQTVAGSLSLSLKQLQQQQQQQSNKWPQNELASSAALDEGIEKKASALTKTGANNNDELATGEGDEEEAGRQAEFDSRNGIGGHQNGDLSSPEKGLQIIGAQPIEQVNGSAVLAASANEHAAIADVASPKGSLSKPMAPSFVVAAAATKPIGQSQQQQPMNMMPMSRPKLLSQQQHLANNNSSTTITTNGNNILNERIISRAELHQRQGPAAGPPSAQQQQQAAYG